MISGWGNREAYLTNTDSLGFVRGLTYRGYSETRRHGLSDLSEYKKNGMRLLWRRTSELLRQEGAANTGPVLRGRPYILRSGSQVGSVQTVQQGETGEAHVAGGQSLLYEGVFLLRGAEVPGHDRHGCGQRTETGLAHRKNPGERVHAGAASAQSCGSTPCHWDRRNLLEAGAYLPDRGRWFGRGWTNLV